MRAERQLVRRVATVAAVLGAACVAGLGFAYGGTSALSAAMGLLVGLGNLWALAELVGHLLGKTSQGNKTRAAILLVLKTTVLFAVVGVILSRPWIQGGSFMAGLTVVALSIAVGGLWGVSSPEAGDDDDAGKK